MVTTVHLPSVKAIAAIIMSFWPMRRPPRRSSGGDAAILECGLFGDGPQLPGRESYVKPLQVALAVAAAFDPVGQFAENRVGDADPVS